MQQSRSVKLPESPRRFNQLKSKCPHLWAGLSFNAWDVNGEGLGATFNHGTNQSTRGEMQQRRRSKHGEFAHKTFKAATFYTTNWVKIDNTTPKSAGHKSLQRVMFPFARFEECLKTSHSIRNLQHATELSRSRCLNPRISPEANITQWLIF